MKFEHSGRSTRGLYDETAVLREAGLRPGDIFLDLGCGDGYVSLAAASLVGPSGRVYGLDIHPPSLATLKNEIARRKLLNVEAIEADATKGIPLPDASIGFCFMSDVLHGFVENGNEAPVMKEIARVTAPAGRLLIVEFKKIAGTPGPPLSVRMSPEQVIELVGKNGFAGPRMLDAGDYHNAVLLKKT